MTISVGDNIPSVTLLEMGAEGPGPVNTDDLFAGKTVAVFGVPGAFTPTCSAQHLPGYKANAEALKAKGVDEIVCLAVNDVFVMDAWGKAQDAGGTMRMLGDGDAAFTKATGLEFDLTGKGLGLRSQRFSMVVKDGTVAALYVDAPGEFKISSAEKMLEDL